MGSLQIAELRLIENVQRIGAELQFISLTNLNPANDGRIQAEPTGTAEYVAAQVTRDPQRKWRRSHR